MHYAKLKSGSTIIEFHNNWLGEEVVTVNGKKVSKLTSIMGANHYFTEIEKGESVNYILTSKIMSNAFDVGLDLRRNGEIVIENAPTNSSSNVIEPSTELKNKALKKLQDYDIEEALELLNHAQKLALHDYEIHFHKACIYSNQEDIKNGYESLKLAVEYGLHDFEKILNHDMLAYLRIQDPFEDFHKSGFTKYDINIKLI